MAISRLQAALAGVTNEVTVAAANINFDFTLVRCEAPKEYQKLGNALSQTKKEQAESGSPHMTARRLGSLFEGICQPTPKLIKAYGLRVSEIADTATELERPDQSIFAAHLGIDGTSIWASATSSSTALQVQLLACMVARVWKPGPAVSIWYELVKERRLQIAEKYEKGEETPFASVKAATQSKISRESLAEWDASARAWLQAADRVNSRRQTKLKLIIDNVDIAVNSDTVVVSSVLDAWQSALIFMENLLDGMPQAVENGSVLLALSSWHIYPRILLIGNEDKEVDFNDPLIPPGGMFTIGLVSAEDTDNRGVYWSLSLKHLKYYGRPIQSEARFNQDVSKVTFEEFSIAIFGAVAGKSRVGDIELSTFATIFVQVQKTLEKLTLDHSAEEDLKKRVSILLKDTSHWWNILARAALAYTEPDNDMVRKLVRLGVRRSTQFIPEPELSRPNIFNASTGFVSEFPFGLGNTSFLMRCLRDREAQIDFLRHLMSKGRNPTWASPTHPVLICYLDKSPYGSSLDQSVNFATVFPVLDLQRKRKRTDAASDSMWSHKRWLTHPGTFQPEGEQIEMIRPQDFFIGNVNTTFRSEVQDVIENRLYVAVHGHIADGPFILQDESVPAAHVPDFTMDEVLSFISSKKFDAEIFLDQITERLDFLSPIMKTMRAVSAASKIYRVLSTATVSIEILNKPLVTARWAEALLEPRQIDLMALSRTAPEITRQIALSCVAYSSCSVDINPRNLVGVFAMAHEDSLYIAIQLTCDPSESVEKYELIRVLGNVGRAGITMLIPPENPIMRQQNNHSWRVVDHCSFNGLRENHFAKTSMHLSFTEFYVPLYLRHGHDQKVYMLESVVSVHDSGVWVGDVDIIKALEDKRIQNLSRLGHCVHNQPPSGLHSSALSAENWNEILDPPPECFVVRSNGNWVGRLAALAILSQTLPQNDRASICVCENDTCWDCHKHFPDQNAGGQVSMVPSMRGYSARVHIY